jgi:hypothetical protein
LNEILGERSIKFLIRSFDSDIRNPLDEAAPEALIAWAQIDPTIRFPRIASAITPFKSGDTKGGIAWTQTALQVLGGSPDPIAVLTAFRSQLVPNVWEGSLAKILEDRQVLVRQLFSYSDPAVVCWARNQDAELGRDAEKERLRENSRERQIDRSFE